MKLRRSRIYLFAGILGFCLLQSSPVKAEEQHQHNFSEWTVQTEATCTESGQKERHCLDEECNEVETEEIQPLGHNFKVVKTIQPDYFNAGYTEEECELCKEKRQVNKNSKKQLGKTKIGTVKQRTPTTLTIQFSKVKGASGYEILANDKVVGTTKSNTFKIKNLKPATKNKITVRPFVQSKDKKKAYAKRTSTLRCTRPKAPVVSVSAGTEKFTVKWKKVSNASFYRVYYRPDGKGKYKFLKQVGKNTTTYTKKADGGRKYDVVVKAFSKIDKSTYSSFQSTKKTTRPKYKYSLYQLNRSTMTYTLKKKYHNQQLYGGQYFAGYYDYRYGKNWRVILINNSKKLLPASYLNRRSKAKILPASSISQLSGRVCGAGACGVSSLVSLVNSQKGTNWQKDDVINYVNKKKFYIDLPLTNWNTHGMDYKDIMQTINSYSNGKFKSKNVTRWNASKVLKENIDKGKTCLINYYHSGGQNHAIVICGYEYINGEIYFYHTDSGYMGYNLPLFRMRGKDLEGRYHNVVGEPRCILTLE